LTKEDETQSNKERIKMCILDFDWLFEINNDEGETNASRFIKILAHTENTNIFA